MKRKFTSPGRAELLCKELLSRMDPSQSSNPVGAENSFLVFLGVDASSFSFTRARGYQIASNLARVRGRYRAA